MYPYLNLFGKQYSTYGFVAFIGFLAFIIGAVITNKKSERDFFSRLLYLVFQLLFGGICAALLFQFTALPTYVENINIMFSGFKGFLQIFSFGIVFYGGLIGIFIGMLVYSQYYKEDTRIWLRHTIPSIALFHVFGRIGCTLGGCCYGYEVEKGHGVYNALIDKYCFPVQLIEAGAEFVIFIILVLFEVFQKNKKDFYKPMGLYFVIYGITRFILEFWRGDSVRGIWAIFSTSQYISMFIVPLGIYCLVCKTDKNFFEKWYNGKKSKEDK